MTAPTQTDAASAKDASVKTEPTAAAVTEQQPAASTSSSTAVTPLTIGEMVEKHLDLKRIGEKSKKEFVSPKCLHVIISFFFFSQQFLLSLFHSVPQEANLLLLQSRFSQINCMKHLHMSFLSRYKLNKLADDL